MARFPGPPELRAIQIISSREEEDEGRRTKNIIITENKNHLENIFLKENVKDLPIFVFSITGKTRGGKSFLLNLMVKYLESQDKTNWMEGNINNVFEWNGGITSVTRGLWICPKIYRMRNSVGKEIGILLLDNQGLFDGQQTEGTSIAISGISTSISHVQMFNLKDKIMTNDLETIWRYMVSEAPSKNHSVPEGKSDTCVKSKCTLMFIVRDFQGSEDFDGYGQDCGKVYIDDEKKRGTEEHTFMWQELQEGFKKIECLTLPHPGLRVMKKEFANTGNLAEVEEEFLSEIDEFFSTLFDPKNLIPQSDNLTGKAIHYALMGFHGKEADDSLAIVNILTEHGNEDKLDILIMQFQSRLEYTDISNFVSLMNEILQRGKRSFKGRTANIYLYRLEETIEQSINCKAKEVIIKKYEHALSYTSIKNNHDRCYSRIKQTLLGVTVGSQKNKIVMDIVRELAAIYYARLAAEMESIFKSKCGAIKSLEDLAGYDEQFISDNFKKCNDFEQTVSINQPLFHAIWLKEQQNLKEHLQDYLIYNVAQITKLDIEWLRGAVKQQYEYFEKYVLATLDTNWIIIPAHDCENLCDLIGFATYGRLSNECSEKENSVIKGVANQILSQCGEDKIRIACCVVVYRHENKDNIEPVFSVQLPAGMLFVDTKTRVYKDWEDYLESNELPDSVYCYPVGGQYNKLTGFKVGFAESPASKAGEKVLGIFDKVVKWTGVGAAGVLGAAMFFPAAPFLVIAGASAAGISGLYGVIRGSSKVVDKVKHMQPVGTRDVLSIVGNCAVIASGGLSAVATILGLEIRFVQSVIQGVIVPLIWGFEDTSHVATLLVQTLQISKEVLFYLNSKSGEEAFIKLKQSYHIDHNTPIHDLLKTVVMKNSIESVTGDEESQLVGQFISTGVKNFLLDLMKLIPSEELDLMSTSLRPSDNDGFYDKMCELCSILTEENESLTSALVKLCNTLKTEEDFHVLTDAISRATSDEKNQFSLLLRNLIYTITSKINKANRFVLNLGEHEGQKIKSYNGVEFHPVEEVCKQIDSIEVFKSCSDVIESLDADSSDERVTAFVKVILKSLCDNTNTDWGLKDFGRSLVHNCSQFLKSFDDGLKKLEETFEQVQNPKCIDIDHLFGTQGFDGGFGSFLLEKTLVGAKINTNLDVNRSGQQNTTIVPAWNGLIDRLYCYSISRNMQEVDFKILITELTQRSMEGYQVYHNESMAIVRSNLRRSPTYYIYQNPNSGQKSGLIYCDN